MQIKLNGISAAVESEICGDYRRLGPNANLEIIAQLHDINKETVVKVLSANGYIVGTPFSKLSQKQLEKAVVKEKLDERVKKLIELSEKGFTLAEVIAETGLSRSTVYRISKENGIFFTKTDNKKRPTPSATTLKADQSLPKPQSKRQVNNTTEKAFSQMVVAKNVELPPVGITCVETMELMSKTVSSFKLFAEEFSLKSCSCTEENFFIVLFNQREDVELVLSAFLNKQTKEAD